MTEEELDRFALGELTPEESRALAQQALDNPDLLDELTAISVARTGLPARRRKRFWPRIAVGAAAVAAVLLWATVLRRPSQPAPSARAVASQPILLARNPSAATPVFRGADGNGDSRPPRSLGQVVSAGDGLASIDLGSLDGLAKGGEVAVIRDGKPIGSIVLTTIFRERARGKLAPGLTVHAGDAVRVPDAAYLGALLDRIDALCAHGDSAGARRIADEAAHLAADFAATGYADLNNLAAIAELRGDKIGAESLYRRALGANPPEAARQSIEANLSRVRGAK